MPIKIDKPNKRSAVTGRQLGRAAQRSENKNSEAAEAFVTSIEVDTVHRATTLARVTRQVGGGRVELQLYTGETGLFPIAGRIGFRGRAANKTDRDACMCVGDYVVLDGAQIVAVLGDDQAKRAQVALHLASVATSRQETQENQDALLAHLAFYPPEVAEGGFDFEDEVNVDAV
jgi:hypothetical protein